MRVDSGRVIAKALLEAIETAERGRFENIERLLLACDQFRQVAASPIDGMHEQADAGRVAGLGEGGVLFEKPPEPVRIACLQEFETMPGVCHGCFLRIT